LISPLEVLLNATVADSMGIKPDGLLRKQSSRTGGGQIKGSLSDGGLLITVRVKHA
jgi:hypothetical protein